MQPSSNKKASRRGFLWGAAATGAAATAVATLPNVQAPSAPAVAEDAPPPPERGGGYRESEHVRRYYKTTRF
ncbi:MAG TPA: twin-arginine translocation signal domain-containing protein [Ramlibacter sp.]|uniref:twin-arginine translocation signal domain-containing protein n=1 Tax=Ramlibacter sp. TaxID=1917967 RepID=UPI002C18E976|nr:twin-arginine translocation signal domain-containing protein [Ramlibacter sp.]HVZ45453.1 twin-arginine translocation signal domain-containing protein [Ramlibacter sp.]